MWFTDTAKGHRQSSSKVMQQPFLREGAVCQFCGNVLKVVGHNGWAANAPSLLQSDIFLLKVSRVG